MATHAQEQTAERGAAERPRQETRRETRQEEPAAAAAAASSSSSSSSSLVSSSSAGLHLAAGLPPLGADAREFVAAARARAHPEEVLAVLNAAIARVDADLLDLINEDYADFVALSAKLVGIDRVVERDIRAPLLAMRQRVAAVRAAFDDAVAVIGRTAEERRTVLQIKAQLDLFCAAAASVQKMERLLALADERPLAGAGAGGDTDAEETSNLVQRVSNELNQLSYLESSGRDLPFFVNLEPRIAAVERRLRAGLEQLFLASLCVPGADDPAAATAAVIRNERVLANCLRTYAAIDRTREAEALFAEWVVRPAADAILTPARLEAEGLRALLADVLRFVEGLRPVIDLARSISGFALLPNAVWAELADALASRLPKIFSPAFPERFHAHYLVAMEFLDGLEARFCSTVAELLEFRAHPRYRDFIKRWRGNLAVYFQLRFQDVAAVVDEALPDGAAAPVVSPGGSGGGGGGGAGTPCALDASAVVARALERCTAPDTFLPALRHRFLRLSLQVLSRYAAWVSAGVGVWELAPAAWVAVWADVDCVREVAVATAAATSQQPQPQQQQQEEEQQQQQPPLLSRAASEFLGPVAARVEAHIVDLVSEACVAALQPLRGIAFSYLHTGKAVAARPSFYTQNITLPLASFVRESASHYAALAARCTPPVLVRVTEQFLQMLTDSLTTLHKSLSMIKKMVKKAPAAAEAAAEGVGGPLSDTDKIHIQFFLDVETYGEQIRRDFHVDLAAFAPYQALLAAVDEGRQRLQALRHSGAAAAAGSR